MTATIVSTFMDGVVDNFPRPRSGVDFQDQPDEADLANAHSDVLEYLEALIGPTDQTPNSVRARLATLEALYGNVVDVRTMGLHPTTDPGGPFGAVNTYVFNTLEGTTYATQAVVFYFPQGDWECAGLALTKHNHRIEGFSPDATQVLYTGSATGGACISMIGAADGWDRATQRIASCEVNYIRIVNHGTQLTDGVLVRHGTHLRFEKLELVAFRQSGLNGSNFADSQFWLCTFDFCASDDDSNTAVVNFNGQAIAWAVDAIKFFGCRWENNGDRILDFHPGNGNTVNKVDFIGCKFEQSAGGFGGAAQFWFEQTQAICFTACDFTLQMIKTGRTPLIALMVTDSICTIQFTACHVHLGSVGAVKPWTNFITTNNSATCILFQGMQVDSGNAASWPDNMLKVVAGIPTVGLSNCVCWPINGGDTRNVYSFWVSGSVKVPVKNLPTQITESGTVVAVASDSTWCNNTGAVVATLPAAGTLPGKEFLVKKIASGGTVTVQGADPVDGVSGGVVLNTLWQYIKVQSNGTNWMIVGKGP